MGVARSLQPCVTPSAVTLFEENAHHHSVHSTAKYPQGIFKQSWGVPKACCRPVWPAHPCYEPIMSDYSHRPGGSLKLKGGVADGGIKKYGVCRFMTSIHGDANQLHRKKKSSKSQDKGKNIEHEKKDPVEEPERIRSESPAGSSGRNSPAASSSRPDRKTKAEKRFDEIQRKRVSPFPKSCAGHLCR
jgi:protein FAM32A